MTDETDLKLGDLVIPVGAGRGISQSIELVSNGDLRRTVNGELLDLTRAQNRKFNSSITATDMAIPALSGVWRGQQLVVECIETFRQNVFPAALTATLIRDYVTGTVKGLKSDGTRIDPSSVVALLATFAANVVAVEFRPKLTMLVSNTSIDRDEYGAETGWTIDLEEK